LGLLLQAGFGSGEFGLGSLGPCFGRGGGRGLSPLRLLDALGFFEPLESLLRFALLALCCLSSSGLFLGS
jgi:hypothetical protein